MRASVGLKPPHRCICPAGGLTCGFKELGKSRSAGIRIQALPACRWVKALPSPLKTPHRRELSPMAWPEIPWGAGVYTARHGTPPQAMCGRRSP